MYNLFVGLKVSSMELIGAVKTDYTSQPTNLRNGTKETIEESLATKEKKRRGFLMDKIKL